MNFKSINLVLPRADQLDLGVVSAESFRNSKVMGIAGGLLRTLEAKS
jgi:hypothetical protein